MNGLTAENVEYLVDLIKTYIESAQNAHRFAAENQFKNVLSSIRQMQKESVPQPSRPDRIGDECWYEFVSYDYVNDNVVRVPTWKRGVLRCWYCSNENCIAMVEDSESHDIVATGNLSFSTEAPT